MKCVQQVVTEIREVFFQHLLEWELFQGLLEWELLEHLDEWNELL